MTEPAVWRHAHGEITIDRPTLFGILNVTPDSFSDGGRWLSVDDALAHAKTMVAEGADAIDVGGESTRPQNAALVSVDEEAHRVLPVIAALREAMPDMPLSIDTTKSEIAEQALEQGASIVNDVSGLRLDPRMAAVCAAANAGVIVMHSRGGVSEMATYAHANYDSVVDEVAAELHHWVTAARAAGVAADAIVVDPGIGFAKKTEHSLEVIHGLSRITALGYPVMIGVSRKRFIGELTGESVAAARVMGTAGANVAALERGARLFRVHDVRQNRQALDVAWAVMHAPEPARQA
jgi:dihydropteroate synthase